MPTEHGDRRRAARMVPDPMHSLSRVRLRAGRELMVIDLSAFGALVEGTTRLLPGTNVDVHITGVQGRVLVRARVTRCAVCALTPDVVRYRGALAFASEVELSPMDARA